MIDKKLEKNIKKTKEFIEIWDKFYRIFKNAEERNFLSTKNLVSSRCDDLMDFLGVKPIERFLQAESIYNILSLENISVMSDEKSEAVRRDWERSFKFLNNLFGRLNRKKRRIEGFNKFIFIMKRMIRRKR